MLQKSTSLLAALFLVPFSLGKSLECSASETALECRLLEQPAKDTKMTAYFEAMGGLKFTQCSIDFDQSNWDKVQSVDLIPIPQVILPGTPFEKKKEDLKIKCSLSNGSGFIETEVVPVAQHEARSFASCSVSGDPHIRSFSGDEIDFQGIGHYVLAESDNLRVLASYQSCGHGVSCISAASVQYFEAAYLFSLESGNEDAFEIKTVGNTSTAGTFYEKISSNAYQIKLEDGSIVSVASASGMLNVDVMLSSVHQEKVNGHCGPWYSKEKKEEDTRFICKGKAYEIYQETVDWGECWKVPEENNCLTGNCAPVPSTTSLVHDVVPQVCEIPSSPVPIAPVPVQQPPMQVSLCDIGKCQELEETATASLVSSSSTPVSTSTSTLTTQEATDTTTTAFPTQSASGTVPVQSLTTTKDVTQTVSSVPFTSSVAVPSSQPCHVCDVWKSIEASSSSSTPIPTPTPLPQEPAMCPISEDEATSWCNKVIEDASGCSKVANREIYVSSCAKDVLKSCTYAFCDSHKTAYQLECATKTDMMKLSVHAEVVLVAHQIRVEAGFGKENSCPNSCSGSNGVCDDGLGCICKPGFSGLDCSVSLVEAPAYDIGIDLCQVGGNKTRLNSTLTANLTRVTGGFSGRVNGTVEGFVVSGASHLFAASVMPLIFLVTLFI